MKTSSVKTEIKRRPIIFVLFGATGDLAVRKIFPALKTLHTAGVFPPDSRIIAVSRRDWDDTRFLSHIGAESGDFAKLVSYSRVDIDHGMGYGELHGEIESLKRKNQKAEVIVYLSLAPRYQAQVTEALAREKIIVRGGGKLLIEKPFGTDEKSAKNLDKLISSFLNENQVYRVDHYLGKDTVMAIMNLHESTENFSLLLSKKNISSIRVRLFETRGVEERGASYDHVGAFRDVGQNHMLMMLATLTADVSEKSWQIARADVLKRLAPPAKTCELSHRGQYEGYRDEIGVKLDSEIETAFEITTSLSAGKLAGVPLILEAGKKMPVSEVFMEIKFKKTAGLPRKMLFNVQPSREVLIEYAGDSGRGSGESDGGDNVGRRAVFEIPGTGDAYANVIEAAISGRSHEFVGREEIEALWRYSDHVVACWDRVPLQIYGENKPFLIQ